MRGFRLLLAALALAAAPAARSAPFLWSYSHQGTTHHLVGSLHLLPEQAQPLPEALTHALDASRVLVFESDIESLDDPGPQQQLLAAAQAPDGIRAEIGDAQYRRLQKQLSALQMPGLLCDAFRAWFCSMTLELLNFSRAGFQPQLGIDQQLYQRARSAGKELRWLEPLPEHLGLFTGMTPRMSREFLGATLDELEQGELSPELLLDIWRRSDLAAIAEIASEMKAGHPMAYERLLAGRNRAWLPRLEKLLRGTEPVLVVVGAAHFAGPDGLLTLLQRRGIELRAVRH